LDNIIYIELGELQPVVPPLGVKENYIVPSTKFEKKKNNNNKDKLHANTQNCRTGTKMNMPRPDLTWKNHMIVTLTMLCNIL